ncbi:hypothetical protein [Nocardioides perillae]|uniref:Uncharacterized protein n=1 Tax=Nocardioides perillae TaxID=1119534 RepID=A0A7Y9RR16_9ACTN|nr:hypothetical protein [Nocardioides perillae]NYG54745.1 hypothetical protein [Nocardioides perillae]
MTHLHAPHRNRARRRYATLSRRAQAEQLLTLLFFGAVVMAFSLVASAPLLR